MITPEGFQLHRGAVGPKDQARLAALVARAAQRAPFRRHAAPRGGMMSVSQTSLGALGWVSDARGYRYVPKDPLTGAPWPEIPMLLLELWRRLASAGAPDSCLINHYPDATARLGLHRDRDEADLTAPVLSLSLGAPALFRIGGPRRGDPSETHVLRSGDAVVLSGPARSAFHGVDKIMPDGMALAPFPGRLNLTLRQAGPQSPRP
jgi:alkylated DNA repair protein (DNA oxidative demethylase)